MRTTDVAPHPVAGDAAGRHAPPPDRPAPERLARAERHEPPPGPLAPPERHVPEPRDWLAACLVGVLAGLGAGLLLARGGGGSQLVLGVGALTGVAIAVVAATRFWAVVVALFVVRASLDALKLSSFGNTTNALDPSVIVGLAFLLSGSLWLFAQWRSGPWYKPSRTTCWFAALSVAGVFSAVGSDNIVQSAQVGLKICAGALMFAVLEQAYRQRPERCRQILAAGAASLIVPALVAISQAQGGEVEQYLEVSRIRGTFVHANPFATYLVVLTVVAVAVRPHLRGRARLAATAVMGTAGALTLFTYARGAWVALIVGLVVIGIKQDRRLLAGLLAMLVVVVVAVPSVTARLSDLSQERVEGRGDPNSLAWRFGYWGRLLPEVADSPVTGIGLEQVLAHSEEGLQPHNVFVQTVVETGLFGLTCLVGLCFAMAGDLRRAIRNASPGLHRGIAVGAAAAALGVLAQLLSENLLTQAAIHWYLAAPVAFAIACSTTAPPVKPAPLPATSEA